MNPCLMAHLLGASIAFLLASFAQGSASADDRKLIRVGKGDWAPYVCVEEPNNGKRGYVSEILEAVYGEACCGVQFTSVNYSRGIRKARDGDYAIMACMYREDAPDLVFPSVSLGKSVNRFYVRKGDPWRLNGVESLADLRVGLVKGYKYPEFQEYIDADPDTFLFVSGETPLRRILKMIAAERLDATFDDAQVVLHEARALGISEELADAGGFGVENPVLVGFSPADERTPELVRILEEGLPRLRTTGELAEILARYNLKDWETRPELTVAVAHWPPWKILNPDGAVGGHDPRILRAMEDRLEVKFRFEGYPWRRCVEMLKDGRVDVVTSFSRTPEREEFACFVTPPYTEEAIVCYARKGHGKDVVRHDDLYGKRVGVIRGSAYTREFDADTRIERTIVERDEQLIRMLHAGRIDVAVAYDRPSRFQIAELGFTDAFDVCPLRLVGVRASHFALSRKSAHVGLADRFGEVVQEMIDSGEIARIIGALSEEGPSLSSEEEP